MMAQGHEGSGGAAAGNSPVVAKDFYWDQVVIIIVTAILGLTVLDISVEFFSTCVPFPLPKPLASTFRHILYPPMWE